MRASALFTSASVKVQEITCDTDHGPSTAWERSSTAAIGLPLRGCYVVERARQDVVADANTAIVFDDRSPYRVEHPIDGGDVTLTISGDPGLLADAFDRGMTHAHLMAPAQFRARLLRRRALDSYPDAFAIEESAVMLLALAAGATRARVSPKAAAAVGRAKAFLAGAFTERLLLADVACAAGTSAFSLSRAFPLVTGMTMHGYLTALRHTAALDALANGASSLTDVAIACGFAHHSHLTKTFVRAFGVTPSAARSAFEGGGGRELST